MGLLSGSASVSRFNVLRRPPQPDFDAARFEEIAAGSERHESRGFIPFQPGGDYRIGEERWAFRLRIDRLRPDATRVRLRLRELIQAEIDDGGEVGPTLRRELRKQAVEEVTAVTSPSTRILECCLDDDLLFVASTAKTQLGIVAEELGRIGVAIEPRVPWLHRGEADSESPVAVTGEPADSAFGSRMMQELLGDSSLSIEPDDGRVRLRSRDTRVALSGVVIHDLLYFLEHGAEILAAKMVAEDVTFDFDVQSFRVTNLRLATDPTEDWKEQLNERLEKIAEVFEMLEMRYYELSHQEA